MLKKKTSISHAKQLKQKGVNFRRSTKRSLKIFNNGEREEINREAVQTWFDTARNHPTDTAISTSTLLSVLPSDAMGRVHLAQGVTACVHSSDIQCEFEVVAFS